MLDDRVMSKPIPKGLDAAWDAGVGFINRLLPRQQRFLKRAEQVLALEEEFSDLSNAKLREAASLLREIFHCRRETPLDMDRAFALIREIAERQIGERHFPVQIAGAFALESSCVAEMATGEGKTLTATMAVTVAGWRGYGCHVITVNDYLARRDAEWMRPIYRFCGLKVAYIDQNMEPAERKAAYAADITYCTNKEVAADFLRDRLVLGRLKGLGSVLLANIAGRDRRLTDRIIQRGLHCAVVDEADSVLVDEAVTPLIISGHAPNPEQINAFSQAADIASQLNLEIDYRINPKYREIELSDEGRTRLTNLSRGLSSFWRGKRRSEELAIQALTAKELYLRDRHYVIEDDKVVIVDEFTGRLMPDRSWRDGLHQAIEAKEKVEITPPKDTYARISFQRFFRLYRKLSGMTGTASEAGAEFWQIYHLPVVKIPTNRPCIRENLPDIILTTTSAKWKHILTEVKRIHQTGRPILIGTRSVHSSEHLSQLLHAENLDHQVLNAVYHRQEAEIVAEAGQPGNITVATNMAGRGTDIKLGRGVAKLGGLYVIAAERNESSRIDRQLFGRCARQGDPGSAQAIICLEDEFVSRYSKNPVMYLRKRCGDTEDDISSRLSRSVFKLAQFSAERLALRQRKSVMRTDHWLDEQLGFAGSE
jgi:preprotein translocase subunit SecA